MLGFLSLVLEKYLNDISISHHPEETPMTRVTVGSFGCSSGQDHAYISIFFPNKNEIIQIHHFVTSYFSLVNAHGHVSMSTV